MLYNYCRVKWNKSRGNVWHRLRRREVNGNHLRFNAIPKQILVKPKKEKIAPNRLQMVPEELVYQLCVFSSGDNWLEFRKIAEELLNLPEMILLTSGLGFQLIENLLNILVVDIFGVGKKDVGKTSSQHLHDDRATPLQFDHERSADIKLILQLVHTFTNQVPETSYYHLRFKYRLIEVLFTLFSETQHRIHLVASAIAEKLLTATPMSQNNKLFSLQSIKSLPAIVSRMNNDSLLYFYHVISVVMSDCELCGSVSLEQHDQWLNDSSVADTAALNQEFLLSLPSHLENMCLSASRPASEVTRPLSLLAHMLGQSFGSLDLENDDFQMMERQIGSSDSYIWLNDIIHRANLFTIITMLLTGKYQNEVQKRLMKCDFVNRLNNSFEEVIWKDFPDIPDLSADSEDISQTTFVRVQFLRLVHSIADSTSYRYSLLSIEELHTLKQIAEKKNHSLPSEFPTLTNDTAAPLSKRSLLSQVMSKLHQESITFWITRVVEAFLRGPTNPTTQAFLLDKNIVESTVGVLISTRPMHELVRQGCFDMLSTVMKVNVDAFTRCDNALNSARKFQTFISAVEDSLIDSNMFIRCVILTTHYIQTSQTENKEVLVTNRLLEYYTNHKRRIQVIARLVTLLDVSTLSQETVSCLNTSLLLLIMAHRNNRLASYLQCLYGVYEPAVLENLYSLLQFWIVHYSLPFKKNDRKSLEFGSLTQFSEWESVARTLLDPDLRSEISIKHYLAKADEIGRTYGSPNLTYIRWP
nr:short transient receptor potential channel 4-associated protein-like isoform X1 [Ciona intestinalis]|eukprot:XP_026695649.1 short transient receptor potential channel 4-associated protein-like isoform X1 [Ciona intestinalis]